MKIKTITCQHVYNYGATLQAYALQHYLESLGHDVEIISYRPAYQWRYKFFHYDTNRKFYRLFHRCKPLLCLYAFKNNWWMIKTYGRKRAFDRFDKTYLRLTSQVYHNIDELRANPPVADLYVAGSDQIWNTDCENGKDASYYLDFGNENAKRVSYAASFAVKEVKSELKSWVMQRLSRFNKISVRETTGLNILSTLGLKGQQVIDPAFLLSAEEWKSALNISTGIRHKGYILLYDFLHDDEKIRNYALALKLRMGLDIVSVNDYAPAKYADIQINNAGPVDFLQQLCNAQFVVCNSFHATAFSLLFHKPFATFPLIKQRNSARMEDLLQTVELSYRFNSSDLQAIFQQIDWQKTDEIIKKEILTSKLFLNSCF